VSKKRKVPKKLALGDEGYGFEGDSYLPTPVSPMTAQMLGNKRAYTASRINHNTHSHHQPNHHSSPSFSNPVSLVEAILAAQILQKIANPESMSLTPTRNHGSPSAKNGSDLKSAHFPLPLSFTIGAQKYRFIDDKYQACT
jgi:hypothetical protein